MACYHPMIRYEDWNGRITISKKPDEAEEKELTNWKTNLINKRRDLIPCGKCTGCRLEYSRQWANRLMLETKKYNPETCWFITLTYNDEHIPTKTVQNEETGEYKTAATLNKKDIQDFMKRLRRHYEYKYKQKEIRFFLAGEYGEQTNRPHYHACIFNMPIYTELKKYKKNELNQQIWTNEEIEKIWGKGFITIGKISWESAAYTARYIMKKQKGPDAEWYYKSHAQEPEFTLMSRKPGIAREYYDNNKDKIYKNDEIALFRGNRAINIKPPKYYDKLYDIEYHDIMKNVKKKRKEYAENVEIMKDKRSSLTRQERREVAERTKKDNTKKLIREL